MIVRLGIIGGGQLGLYLCQAARALSIPVSVLAEAADAPARQFADLFIVGELDDMGALEKLLANSDVITFEKEDIPNETLAYLIEAQVQERVAIHPGADSLLMLKDKGLQKTWLQRHELPTLPFHILADKAISLAALVDSLGGALVQKARCGGYDGRGVQILKNPETVGELWDVPSIVEPYLPNCREISVLTVRAKNGDIQTYPPVSMEFDSQLNSVTTVVMPAAVSSQLADRAIALAERVVTLLDGVGVFAIEMFITPEDEVLINEISPRVHNSGHLTLDACNVSQFEHHVRAVTGLPLVAIEAGAPAAMLNILYTESMRERCPEKPVVQRVSEPPASIYWYGKAPGTSGRKMGHINAVAPSVAAALEAAEGALAQPSPGNGEQAA